MENILDKIYSHSLNDNMIKQKIKKILSLDKIKILFNNKNEKFYKNNTYFIKYININKNEQYTSKQIESNNNSIFLHQFPKEILIIYLLKKELPENIISINNYYFSDTNFLLIMNNDGELFLDFIKKNKNNKILDSICLQLFFILAILQDKFEFMHKNLNFNNIIIKKYNDTIIKYTLKDITYEVKTYNYIPVLYNFSYSTIFKIYDKKMEIYDKETNKKNITTIVKNSDFITNYREYILKNNYFISSYDIFYLISSFKYKQPIIYTKLYRTDVISKYFSINFITTLFNYSESYTSMYNFIIKYYDDMNIKDKELKIEINQDIIDTFKNAKIIILKNGLGNKLMTIMNIIYKYPGEKIFFLEQLSRHQLRSFYDKLKHIFLNLNPVEEKNFSEQNYKLISWKLFDALKPYGIKETEYDPFYVYFTIPGLINLTDTTRNLLKINPLYEYLLDKYDIKNGIFAHYRLGDKFDLNYEELKNERVCKFTLLTPEYYIDNISKMLKEKPGKVYIMSDSINIAECLLKDKIPDAIFINENCVETFFLMTHCNRFIISESTMTVSAIYLNTNKPQVIAPNFLTDFYDNSKIISNKYFNDKQVTFDNNKNILLNTKQQYDEINKKCYKKINL